MAFFAKSSTFSFDQADNLTRALKPQRHVSTSQMLITSKFSRPELYIHNGRTSCPSEQLNECFTRRGPFAR